MKRRDLMKRLQEIADAEGAQLVATEGGKHTKIVIGDRTSYVPRHREINELTARAILQQLDSKGE